MSRRPDEWFLTADQRGNPDTRIDEGRDGRGWTTGNAAEVLVDGVDYFARLAATLATAAVGDTVLLAGLEMDADQILDGTGTTLGGLLVGLCLSGVTVRALLWRSHPNYTAARNRTFARTVNAAGGEVLLDNRIRRLGSLHQKIVVLCRARGDDVAFVGGIDLSHGGHDDAAHGGDAQRADLSSVNYGERPPWHDVQLQIRGPAVRDVVHTFVERWNDPTRLDRRSPWHRFIAWRAGVPAAPSPMPVPTATPPGDDGAAPGRLAIQVLRTYPARRPSFPFARTGERSIARAYLHAFSRARRLVYLEDQYLWSYAATSALVDALWREPELRVVIVIPRFPDPAGSLSGPASAVGRLHVTESLTAAGGDRVAVYDLVNEDGVPIYVHSKACIIDDRWLAIGSDNLNRRSWSHDSEISCAVVDPAADTPDALATTTRLRLTAEHLGRAPGPDLLEPKAWFDAFAVAAAAGRAWEDAGRSGPRPPGRVRVHAPDPVGHLPRVVVDAAHRLVLDPDGRPRSLRRVDRY